jgi:hypothetical protein
MSTCSALSEPTVSATTSSEISAITTDTTSSCPALRSGSSIQRSHWMSRSGSNMKSRKIMKRKMPPKAAMAGCAASSFSA